MTALIKMRGISKVYRRGEEEVRVLDNLDFEVKSGESVALMGPSGSGKTPTLNLSGAIDHPDQGSIEVNGMDITSMKSSALPAWRSRHIGFVFQSFNLVPVLTALENVMLPLLLTPLNTQERVQQATFALDVVGLADRKDHRPRQLSGGQEQRVAIARAIATDPDIILADEPTGDLDRESSTAVMDLLDQLNRDLGKTLVMVTHDPLVGSRAQRTLHLDKGVLEEQEHTAKSTTS